MSLLHGKKPKIGEWQKTERGAGWSLSKGRERN